MKDTTHKQPTGGEAERHALPQHWGVPSHGPSSCRLHLSEWTGTADSTVVMCCVWQRLSSAPAQSPSSAPGSPASPATLISYLIPASPATKPTHGLSLGLHLTDSHGDPQPCLSPSTRQTQGAWCSALRGFKLKGFTEGPVPGCPLTQGRSPQPADEVLLPTRWVASHTASRHPGGRWWPPSTHP